MWDYSEKVMDHYRNPRNVGKIDDADAVGIAGSLACGDQLKIYLKIKDNIVTDAKFQTSCKLKHLNRNDYRKINR